MYCSNCAQALPADTAACNACGHPTAPAAPQRSAAQEIGERWRQQAREASGNAWGAFRTLAVNPVGGLAGAFQALGQARALQVAVVFAVAFDLCVVAGTYRLVRNSFLWGFGAGESWFGTVLKLAFLGAVSVAASTGALLAARKVLRGEGSPAGDLFIATTALLPQGVAVLLSGFLGIGNFEVIAILMIFALCLSVLLIHQGCREISGIGEPGASLAVPLVVLLSAWLTKILLSALA